MTPAAVLAKANTFSCLRASKCSITSGAGIDAQTNRWFGFEREADMHRHRACTVGGLAFSLLAAAAASGQDAAPQIRIETVYPRYAARGRTTVINVALPSRDAVQAAEIAPATGVTVSAINGRGSETEQAVGWWEITLDIGSDAAPGDRSLVLVTPMGRTAPATISIPTHIPSIADLRIVSAQTNQPAVDVTLTAADAAGDLGDAPYVWFTAGCGGEPLVGAVRGHASAGVVRAAFPHLRDAAGRGTAAVAACDLRVRVTDSTGIDSNTLTTTVEFSK
jgi:hypothetical protein